MKKLSLFIGISLLHAALWAQTTFYTSGLGGEWQDPLTWQVQPDNGGPAGPPSAGDAVVIRHYVSQVLDGAYTQTGDVTIAQGGTYELVCGTEGIDRYTFGGTRFEVAGTLLCTGDFAHQATGSQGTGLLHARASALIYIGGDLILQGHGGLQLDGNSCGALEVLGSVAFRGVGSYAYGPGQVLVHRTLRIGAGSEEVPAGSQPQPQLTARISRETRFLPAAAACAGDSTLAAGEGVFATADVIKAFGAQAQANGIALRWQLTSDLSHREYVIERAREGGAFEPVGRVAAQGHSWGELAYTYWDSERPQGNLRYRLRVLRQDGQEHMQEIQVLEARSLLLFPNPADGPVVNLLAPGFESRESLVVEVRNALGQVIIQYRTEAQADGTCQVQLETQSLRAGTYLVSLRGQQQRLSRTLRVN